MRVTWLRCCVTICNTTGYTGHLSLLPAFQCKLHSVTHVTDLLLRCPMRNQHFSTMWSVCYDTANTNMSGQQSGPFHLKRGCFLPMPIYGIWILISTSVVHILQNVTKWLVNVGHSITHAIIRHGLSRTCQTRALA